MDLMINMINMKSINMIDGMSLDEMLEIAKWDGSNVSVTAEDKSFKVSETKYKFWPVININHTAKDLSIILKGGGGVGSQATGTFDLLANMEHINLTKVPLYGNNSKAPSVMKVPEPSERVWNEVINRLRKSSGLLIDDSIVNLGYDEFIEEGVFNVPAWKRAIVMISFVTMALENWESFSKASYITSMRVGSHYASYWRVS